MPGNERFFKCQITDASAPSTVPAKYNVIDRETGIIKAGPLAKKQAMSLVRRLNAGEPLIDNQD